MARAENQGLQIALILFVMLTIVLAVVTFFYVRGYNEALVANKDLEKRATDSKKLADSAQTEINRVKELLGVNINTTLDNLNKSFEDDMKLYAATLPPDKLHYRDALEALWVANRELNDQYASSQNAVKSLQEQLDNREKERDAQITQHEKRATDNDANYQSELAKFNSDRKRITDTNSDLNSKLTQSSNDKAQALASAAKEQQAAREELKKVSIERNEQSEKVKRLRDNSFEIAHGHIVEVDTNVRPHLAYIDLGSEDRLLPLITFSVHDKMANTTIGEGLKARIEVVDILGPHLAACRILDEDLDNPIGKQDKIYTPLWQPGQLTHFALLGNIDLTGDGEDDRAMVKDIIENVSKGVIDAEMDSQGKITGAVTPNTRFLIEGDIPADKLAAAGAAELIGRAEAVGVERIGAAEFLKMSGMKYDPRQTIRFGTHGTGALIPAERTERERAAISPKAANFQKRRPWNAKAAMERGKSHAEEPQP